MKGLSIMIGCIALALSVTSCDSFLEVRPKAEKVEEDLFSNAQGFEDAIYGVYGSMQQSSLYGRDLMWGVSEVLAQNLSCGSVMMKALAKYDYSGNDDLRNYLSAIWTTAYATIGYANNVLKNLEGHSTKSLPLYNYYKGEMLAVRAMLHFDMLRLFAPISTESTGIPYVTSYSYSVKSFRKVGEVYSLILEDLLEAESLLAFEEDKIAYPHNNTYYNAFENYRETHCNLYAVRALLARVYWMKGDMTNAAKYAENVINSKKFPLVDQTEVKDYLTGVLSPKETIFGLYSNTTSATAISYLYNFQSFYSYDPYYDGSGMNHLLPYTTLYELDVNAMTQDLRRSHFEPHTGYARFLKLVDYYTAKDESRPIKGLIPGITLIHTSEMYLIAAEALLEADYDKALEYFDTEIASRGLTPLSVRGVPLTKEIIYNEYHKELFGEGQVWFNMKRLNKDIISNLESRVIPASNSIYVVPIPEEEYEYRDE